MPLSRRRLRMPPTLEDDSDDDQCGSEVRKKLKAAMSLVSMAGLDGRLKSGDWKAISDALVDVWKVADLPDTHVREFCCETVCVEILCGTPMKAMGGNLGLLCQSRLFCNRLLSEKRQEPNLTNDDLKEWSVKLFTGCVYAAFHHGHPPDRSVHVCQRIVINMLRWKIGIVHQIVTVLEGMRISPFTLFPTSVGDGAIFPSTTEPLHRSHPAEEALRHAPTFLYYLLSKPYDGLWPEDPHAMRLRSGTLHALQRVSWQGYLIALANCYGGASSRNNEALV
jgi:hypothetical protein